MNQQSRIKNNNGFTLVEMLIALGIIAILSFILAVNFKNFRTSANLDSETEQVSSLLRQAQLWALTGQTRSGTRPVGGWGVHLEQCSAGACTYFMFADLWPAAAPNRLYDAGNDEKITDINMNKFVEVFSLNPVSGNDLDIIFGIPTSTVYFNGSQADNEAVITLEDINSSSQRIIRVDRRTGRINIE